MLFKFKILQSENDSKILGMFGDCIKIRLNSNFDIKNDFKIFIARELGTPVEMVNITDFIEDKNMVFAELPDLSYEILMSWVENKS